MKPLKDVLVDGVALRCVRIHANKDMWHTSVNLYSRAYFYGSKPPLDIIDVVTAEVEDNLKSSPFLTIDDEQAQELMDSLWGCGVRPSESIRRQADSSFNHLEDMRRIAFASLRWLGIGTQDEKS